MHERALSNKITNDRAEMAIAISLPGFNDLGRAVGPFYFFYFCLFLMDHFIFQFSTFSIKIEKIYRLEV